MMALRQHLFGRCPNSAPRLDAGLRVIVVLAVSGELAAIFMNVVSRYLFDEFLPVGR